MKKSKSLLFTAPVLAGALFIGIPMFAQSSHAEAEPFKAPTPANANKGVAEATTTPSAEVRAATTASPAPLPGKLGFADKRFVTKTAENGQLEIALADLASQRATSPEIRTFAQQLVSEHTAMARQLWNLASAKGLSDDIAQYATREGAIALAAGSEPSSVVASATSRNQPGLTNYDETQRQASVGAANTASRDSIVGISPSNQPGLTNYDETKRQSRTASENSLAMQDRVATTAPGNQPGLTNYDETKRQARANTDGSVATLPPPVTSEISNRNITQGSQATRELASADVVDRTRANPDSGVAGAPTGVDIPAQSKDWNDPTKDRAYKRLADKSGAEFDQAFISGMVSDHEKEVEAFEKRAKDGTDMDVKEFAASHVAGLREHLEKARSLSSKVTTP